MGMGKLFKTMVLVSALSVAARAGDAGTPPVGGDDETGRELFSLLSQLELKSEAWKPTEHEVTVPTASAGARGAAIQIGNRFTPVWPDVAIPPLTVLAQVIKRAIAEGQSWSSIHLIIMDFADNYPEFREDQLFKDLQTFLQTEKTKL